MKLPQCEIIFEGQNLAEEILLVNGGRRPDTKYFLELAKGKKIFAVDKGIEICHATKILPKMLIGDFDSAEKFSVDWARQNNVPVSEWSVDKDFTDLQLAFFDVEDNYKKNPAIITGTFGGRFDHLYSVISYCAHRKNKIFLADEQEIIFFIKKFESVQVNFIKKPFAISLLPITKTCEGVSINNVRWKLKNAKLSQTMPYAISNRLEGEEIKINLHSGILAVYFVFES